MTNQAQFEKGISENDQPIYRAPPNKLRGEVFPTVWHSSSTEAIRVQLSLFAKVILVAENPHSR